MLTAIFKIGVRMRYIAETMFNKNNPHVRNLPLSLSLRLCSLPRFTTALSACNEPFVSKKVRTLHTNANVIYKLFVRDRWIFARRVIYIRS